MFLIFTAPPLTPNLELLVVSPIPTFPIVEIFKNVLAPSLPVTLNVPAPVLYLVSILKDLA